MMHVVIDLAILAILAFCVWRGYRRGLVLGLFGVIAIFIGLFGANILAETFSDEFTDLVSPFIGGIVDSEISDGLSSDDIEITSVNEASDSEIEELIIRVFNAVGFSEIESASITDDLMSEIDKVKSNLSEQITSRLSSVLAYVFVFIIAFMLIMILLTVIANLINLAFRLPGLDLLNNIGGAALGLVRGLLIVLVVTWVFNYLGFLIPQEAIEKSILLEFFMKVNPISGILLTGGT